MSHIAENGEITGTLVTMVKKNFPRAKRKSFGPNDDLFEKGIIDSMGFLSIITYIEEEFNIDVSDEELLPENFSTVGAMSKYIDHKLGS